MASTALVISSRLIYGRHTVLLPAALPRSFQLSYHFPRASPFLLSPGFPGRCSVTACRTPSRTWGSVGCVHLLYVLLSAFVFSLRPPRCDTRLGLPLLPSAATQADSSSSSSAFACIVATPWVIFILAATEANRRRCSLYPRARCAPLLTDPRAPESHLFRIVSFVALGHRLHYAASTLRRVDRERGRWLRD